MIEKTHPEEFELYNVDQKTRNLLLKVNQLVDTVKEQQQQLNNHECRLLDLQNRIATLDDPTYHETERDPYAEQRKWIGKVCRFWFNDINDTCLDYLDKIRTGENGIEYYGKETYDWFPHCKPILPTDNAIYKGE